MVNFGPTRNGELQNLHVRPLNPVA